jgi:hypothetical protein
MPIHSDCLYLDCSGIWNLVAWFFHKLDVSSRRQFLLRLPQDSEGVAAREISDFMHDTYIKESFHVRKVLDKRFIAGVFFSGNSHGFHAVTLRARPA